ncbi:Hypothetical protein NGAL_HAMBI2605_10490 [Neorhizobium galegae bv. orientalis]|nr:Hypothetical protein NGAL_HAMBI2605_10490 [Neorhizobium galegae bv. orientalis]
MRSTRRTFLGGIAVASLPVASVAAAAPVTPSIDEFLAKANPAEKARYHANALAEAMNEHRPGAYRTSIDHEYGFAIVVDDAWKKQKEGPLLADDRSHPKLSPPKRGKAGGA